MNRRAKLIVFLTAISIALANKYIINVDNKSLLSTFMRCYFNDIVGACGYCAYCDYSSELFTNKSLSAFVLFLITILSGIVWEYITPLFREDTVSDICDILAYAIGSAIYILIRRLLFTIRQKREVLLSRE